MERRRRLARAKPRPRTDDRRLADASYYAANRIRKLEWQAEYRRANWQRIKPVAMARTMARRALVAQVDAEVFTREEIADRDGWRCHLCGDDVDPRLTFPSPDSASLDHVLPLSAGGAHTRANCNLAHLGCNASKNYRMTGVSRGYIEHRARRKSGVS